MSTWAMGDDFETLQTSGNADVNLVASTVGLRAAKVLWETCHIPYVIGTPNQWLAEDISHALEMAVTQQTATANVYLQNRMPAGDRDHFDRRAGHYGIVGSRYREKIWMHDPCTVSVKGMRIFCLAGTTKWCSGKRRWKRN